MSRTDHPRINGTHRAGHTLRSWVKDDWDRMPVRPTITKAQAIAESIADDAPVIDTPGLKILALAGWERELMRGFDGYVEQAVERDGEQAMTDLRNDAERYGVDVPEGVAWSGDLADQVEAAEYDHYHEDEYRQAYFDVSREEYDEPEPEHWLAHDPHDFFQSVGDGWVVEGPSVTRPEPAREGHYVRVHELAREVGIESKNLVRHLRLVGEYVKGHFSFVAMPVAERVKAESDALVEQYGARKATQPDPIARLRTLLAEEDVRAKVARPRNLRPGAPRPGNNPFSPNNLVRSR